MQFSEKSSPRAALETLRQEADLDEREFVALIDEFVAGGLLADSAGHTTPNPDDRFMFGSVLTHLAMLRDTPRTLAYKHAIRAHTKGKRVIEIGTGTSVLSLFAAEAGAKSVVALEETHIASLAENMIAANGYSDIISVWRGNSFNYEPNELADVLVHEIIGVDPIDENVVRVLADARRFLAPGGVMIPSRLEVCGVLLQSPENAYQDPVTCAAEAREFGRVHGVDVGPLVEAISQLPPGTFAPVTSAGPEATLRRRILSEEEELLSVDFMTSAVKLPDEPVSFRVTKDGTADSLLVYFRAHLDDKHVLTNSPYLALSSWGRHVIGLPDRPPVRTEEPLLLRVGVTTTGRPRICISSV